MKKRISITQFSLISNKKNGGKHLFNISHWLIRKETVNDRCSHFDSVSTLTNRNRCRCRCCLPCRSDWSPCEGSSNRRWAECCRPLLEWCLSNWWSDLLSKLSRSDDRSRLVRSVPSLSIGWWKSETSCSTIPIPGTSWRNFVRGWSLAVDFREEWNKLKKSTTDCRWTNEWKRLSGYLAERGASWLSPVACFCSDISPVSSIWLCGSGTTPETVRPG